MAVFEIGQPSPLGNTIPGGAICDIDDSGLLVVMNFGVPTLDERAAFQTGAPYEFRLVRLRGVLFLLARLVQPCQRSIVMPLLCVAGVGLICADQPLQKLNRCHAAAPSSPCRSS